MALKHSGLCLFYEKVRNGPDTPHPLQFYFVTNFPVPPQKLHSILAPHFPKAYMYRERNSKARMRVLG